MSKVRSDSILDSMPLHQQERLIAWLIEDSYPMPKAVGEVWSEFGVKTSVTAMYTYYRRHCAPRLLQRAREAADSLPEASGGLTANWDASSTEYLKQKFFELLASPDAVDPKQLIAFGQLVQNGNMIALKTRELTAKEEGFRLRYEQKQREIELAEAKFENAKFKVAEQTKKLRDKGETLSDEERLRIVSEVDRIMGITT